MSNKDYEIKTLTKIVTTIGEFQTELTREELETRVEEAVENGTKLKFHSLITEMTFGNKINTCKEEISIDLLHVHILGYKSSYDIVPKLSEKATLEAIEKRNEKQEARLKEIENQKSQYERINILSKTVADLELDKKEKELIYEKELIEEDIKDLDEWNYDLPEKKAD